MENNCPIDEIITKLNINNFSLPPYLKQILIYSGFDNLRSLASFDTKKDIATLEKFAKEDLAEILEDEKEKKKIFGMFAKKISSFKIVTGHIKLLEFFVDKCKTYINNSETQNKLLKKKANSSSIFNPQKNKRARVADEEVLHSTDLNANSNSKGGDLQGIQQESDLQAIEHIQNTILKYVKPLINTIIDVKEKDYLLKKFNQIHIELYNGTALITCPACCFVSKTFTKTENKNKTWVLSNFNKHFRAKHLKIISQKCNISDEKIKTQRVLKNNSILSFFESKKNSRSALCQTQLSENSSSSSFAALLEESSNGEADHQENQIDVDISYIESFEEPCIKSNPLKNLVQDINEPFIGENFRENISQNNEIIQVSSHVETTTSSYPSSYPISIDLAEEKVEQASFPKDFSNISVNKKFCEGNITGKDAQIENIACNIIAQNLTPQKNYSRQERLLRKRILQFDEAQLKMTDFFSICNEILNYIISDSTTTQRLNVTFKAVHDQEELDLENPRENPSNNDAITSFFEMVKEAALRNSKTKSKSSNRFSYDLKKLCLYIFITSGRLAYETLCSNMSNALPSITTLYRTFDNFTKTFEGQINFHELKEFLLKRNYPLKVFISEDQTALVRRVRYNSNSNQMVGFVCNRSDGTGFPLPNQYSVKSVNDIKYAFENAVLSNYAYIFMAQPLVDYAPAFCLVMFGSDNRFSADEVLKRWSHLENEANANGISIEGFSSDGDTRCLKAMKLKANFPSSNPITSPYSPYFKAEFCIGKPIVVQDTIHISTKLKTRLLNSNVQLQMGNYVVSKSHLEIIIEDYSKSEHFLTSSYLDGTDKMNFKAIDKMSSSCVTELLKNIPEAQATRQLLILTRYILDSFLDKSLTLGRRIYLMWYSNFFFRLWRLWIKNHPIYCLGKNWITLNAYICIELNAHALLILTEKYRDEPELLLPWLFSSQPCEKFFRQTRSMTSTYSTVVNFDMLDILRRQQRIQIINEIVSDSGEKFVFPREETIRMGNKCTPCLTEIPSVEEIRVILEDAKCNALDDFKGLGMAFSSQEEKEALEEVLLTQIDYHENDEITILDNITICNAASNDASYDIIEDDELIEDLEEFKNIKKINIKDFPGKENAKNNSFLKVKAANKILTVKKSTLCWIFSDSSGRLSTDRLSRFKGPQKNKVKNINRNKKETTSETTLDASDSSDSYISYTLESDVDSDDLGATENEEKNEELPNLSIKKEHYYAVYYDDGWYIGMVLDLVLKGDTKSSTIKFLKMELDSYVWPTEEDIQNVTEQFIFYGPVKLSHNEPFNIKRSDKCAIEKKYKDLKKQFLSI